MMAGGGDRGWMGLALKGNRREIFIVTDQVCILIVVQQWTCLKLGEAVVPALRTETWNPATEQRLRNSKGNWFPSHVSIPNPTVCQM